METELEEIKLLLTKTFLKGFEYALLDVDKLGHTWRMILARNDDVGLLFENKVVDLEERKEEGQLIVSEVQSATKNSYLKIEFPELLGKNAKLCFLLSQDEKNVWPSGLRILDEKGIEHNIVAGAAPNSLVFLTPYYEEKRKPEYPLDYYKVCPI